MDNTEPERDQEIQRTLEQSAKAQEEAANVLRMVASRLDKLSLDMRKHGAYPIAGQIDREARRVERKAGALANGR